MVNKCVGPKCTSGFAINEKKQTAKFHFPLKNVESNQLWIHFVSGRDWLATKVYLQQQPPEVLYEKRCS